MKRWTAALCLCVLLGGLMDTAQGQQRRDRGKGLFGLPPLSIGSRKSVTAEGYELTSRNGPYMVLVTTFLGPSAKANALKLVRELREKHGIDAYIYAWTKDRPTAKLAPQRQGWFSKLDQVAVLAGNFPSMNGEAQRMLRRIKKLQPESLKGQGPFPLRGAIIVYNPLIPPGMRKQNRKTDPLLQKINRGKYNIVHCPGKYTIQVAVWTGQVLFGPDAEKELKPSQKLYEAAAQAEELVRLLRKAGYEAYVFHGRQISAVTVGSFDRVDDPQIGVLIRQLAGKRFGKYQLLKMPVLVHKPTF